MSVDVGYKKWLPGLGRWQYIPESFKVAVVFDSADKIGGPTLCFPNADDSRRFAKKDCFSSWG
jgi:hypothetical protein